MDLHVRVNGQLCRPCSKAGLRAQLAPAFQGQIQSNNQGTYIHTYIADRYTISYYGLHNYASLRILSMSSSEAQIAHRRNIPKSPAATESIIQDGISVRQILEGAASSTKGGRGIDPYDRGSLSAETLGSAAEVIRGALPALVPWTIIFSLIFGGCCSNVGSSCRNDV